MNDVKVQVYYIGRMIEEIGYFDMMDLGELSDHELAWEQDGFRPDMNQYLDHLEDPANSGDE